ncbi:MAG: hypothetical protein KatS3mg076_2994 [Candidatus Binatia bacterium]|nr:MAG: hypothetical protein KatS3mg076_2994 [Candidatus Binatia bacterium]
MSDDRRADPVENLELSPYASRLGVVVEEVRADSARIRIPYKDENSNPGKALHGGVAASAIELAGSLAAGSSGEKGRAVDLAVSYLAAAIGEDIVAEASVLRRGKSIVYTEVDVRNEGGKRIAKGLLTWRSLGSSSEEAGEPKKRSSRELSVGEGRVPDLARALVRVPFIARLGLVIEHMEGGDSRIRLPARPENLGEDGAADEGALAALLDTTGAMAAWSVVGLDLRYKASTVGIHVSFHERLPGEELLAFGRNLYREGVMFLDEVVVAGARSGVVAATGSVTYRIVT